MHANILSNSPSKVLDSDALDAWENDFTRFQQDNSHISSFGTPATINSNLDIMHRQCQDATLEADISISSDISSAELPFDDKFGNNTFCFQCLSHDCQCPMSNPNSSVETPTQGECDRLLCTLCHTPDSEHLTNSSSLQSSPPTFQLEYINELVEPLIKKVNEHPSIGQQQTNNNGMTTPCEAENVMSSPSEQQPPLNSFLSPKLEATEAKIWDYNEQQSQNDNQSKVGTTDGDTPSISSQDNDYIPEHVQTQQSPSPTQIKVPKPTEYSIKHQYLCNSAFVTVYPSNETIVSLLPRVVAENIVQDFEISILGAVPNSPREPDDLYSPHWLRGIGIKKEGLCPLCDPVNSSTNGVWLKTKTSRFWYHMNFYHGISAANGRPYSPPVALRAVQKQFTSNSEKQIVLHQGYCGRCGNWVDLEGKQPLLVPELKWWKHAQKCHLLGEAYNVANKVSLDKPSINVSLPI